MIQHSKKADEIAELFGLSSVQFDLRVGKKIILRDEQEWQFIREQVYARIPHESALKWLDEEVRVRVTFEGGAE